MIEQSTSTVVQTTVLLEVRRNKFAKRMIETTVTLDARPLSARGPSPRYSLRRTNAFETKKSNIQATTSKYGSQYQLLCSSQLKLPEQWHWQA